MHFPDFFHPLSADISAVFENAPADSLWNNTEKYTKENAFPFLNSAQIAVIGVDESRGATIDYDCKHAADYIRTQLYQLKMHGSKTSIVDLGNLKLGVTVNDTYAAVGEIVAYLARLKIIPVIIGSSQDLTYGHYKGYKILDQIINIVGVDARFDLGLPSEPLTSNTWLGNIVLDQPNYLFNYSHIGHQTYFVGQYAVNMMDNLFFDTYRLGQVREDMKELEPIVRNADVLTIDMSSIRSADAPGTVFPSPNGLDGENICQLMYYAGMSDKLEGVGLYEYHPSSDRQHQTALLMAQMIWYFIDGFNNRKKDVPDSSSSQFTVYRVTVSDSRQDISFMKSNISGRWWMELPLKSGGKRKLDRHQLIPCSYADYQTACNNEIPERWWQALKKLS